MFPEDGSTAVILLYVTITNLYYHQNICCQPNLRKRRFYFSFLVVFKLNNQPDTHVDSAFFSFFLKVQSLQVKKYQDNCRKDLALKNCSCTRVFSHNKA